MNLLTISEKMKEIEKLKVESFEKKTKEKPIIYQQYDRLAANFQSFNNNLPSLMDYLKGFLQINEENLQEGSFNVQDMENTSRYQDIEILKYEERIIKNEAELDLAKKGLELYMEHFKEMEERMESLNNENNEKLFSQQETLDLRLENNKLKEENKYLLDLNKKLEENIMNTFKKLELKASINKIEDKAITLCNNSKMMNSSERKTVKKTKGVEKINETKRVFKQILENLQIVQKNLVNFSGFENEIVKNLKENLKNSENRISQYEKVSILIHLF